MSFTHSSEISCFVCDSFFPCDEVACWTRQIYISTIWGLSLLIFTFCVPVIYNNFIKTFKLLSQNQKLYRLRRNIIFFTALFTAFVGFIKSILFSVFNEASLSIYILTNALSRITTFGGLTEVIAILITWVQILEACKTLKPPNNNFLYKAILFPYMIFSIIFIIILAVCERIAPSSIITTRNVFTFVAGAIGVILIVSFSIAGIRLYLLLRRSAEPSMKDIANKASYFVFINIGFLCGAIISIVIFIIVQLNSNILNYMMNTFFMLFMTFAGISMSLKNTFDDKKADQGPPSSKNASNENSSTQRVNQSQN